MFNPAAFLGALMATNDEAETRGAKGRRLVIFGQIWTWENQDTKLGHLNEEHL